MPKKYERAKKFLTKISDHPSIPACLLLVFATSFNFYEALEDLRMLLWSLAVDNVLEEVQILICLQSQKRIYTAILHRKSLWTCDILALYFLLLFNISITISLVTTQKAVGSASIWRISVTSSLDSTCVDVGSNIATATSIVSSCSEGPFLSNRKKLDTSI